MNTNELLDSLAKRNAAIVHFSHHADMRSGVVFPGDMHNAIVNRDKWSLSCCVLWPGHQMDLPGSVGVIFEPITVININSVSSDDSGSYQSPDGTDNSAGEAISKASFNNTFNCHPGRYNEWRVQGASVKGIFVADPNAILVKKLLLLEIPGLPDASKIETIGMEEISLKEIFETFPAQHVFTMGKSGLVEITRP